MNKDVMSKVMAANYQIEVTAHDGQVEEYSVVVADGNTVRTGGLTLAEMRARFGTTAKVFDPAGVEHEIDLSRYTSDPATTYIRVRFRPDRLIEVPRPSHGPD